MLLALGANKLGSRFGLMPGSQAFRWAYLFAGLFVGLGKWACAPIFQTLSLIF